MIKLIALVPLFPLIGFLINGFYGKKLSKGLSGGIASVSVLASFIVAVIAFLELHHSANKSHVVELFSWINADTLKIPFEFLYDPLSAWFLLIITGIGFLGAGLIFNATKGVQGVTTAATVFATSAMACAVGLGFQIVGIAFTFIIVGVLRSTQVLEKTVHRNDAQNS